MFFRFFKFYTITKKKFKFKRNTKSIFFKNKFCLQLKVKQLSRKIKNQAGRGSENKIIFRNRGSILKKFKQLKINYHYKIKKLSFIASFQFIPFKNKLVTLLYFMDGSVTYFNTTSIQKLFTYNFLFLQKNKQKLLKTSFWSTLSFIKKLTYICCVGKMPWHKAKYIRSPGTTSRIMEIDKKNQHVLLFLPSKKKFLLSIFTAVLFGQNALKSNRRFLNRKAGYWRTFGKNSIVRGVAMNPVDHPHGGRTKSIKYPKTPWGKTTKFK